MLSIDEILGPGGLVARNLPSYEHRPQQVEMAHAIAEALDNSRHLLAEAGTGVGKTFAYLVPALLAIRRGVVAKPVVVATRTINLQDQLLQKDIPFLQKILPFPFTAVLVLGRSNYLSLRRFDLAWELRRELFADPEAAEHLRRIQRWIETSEEGLRKELDPQPPPGVWDRVASETANCLGHKCPRYKDCFFYKARNAILEADLVIANHALFFEDLKLWSLEPDIERTILGDYQVVIFDEAHDLEDVAREHLARSVRSQEVMRLLDRLFSPRRQKGLVATLGDTDLIELVLDTREEAFAFFESLEELYREQRPDQEALDDQYTSPLEVDEDTLSEVENLLGDKLRELADALKDAAEDLPEEHAIELKWAQYKCEEIAGNLEDWMKANVSGWIYTLALRADPSGAARSAKKQMPDVEARFSPIYVGDILDELLFATDRVRSVICTSATLATRQNDFRWFKDSVGLSECDERQFGSPFDYRKQAQLHLFREEIPPPDKDAKGLSDEAIQWIRKLLEQTQGHALVLFTSWKTLRDALARLEGWCKSKQYPLMCQDAKEDRDRLLKRFRSTPHAVLLGVASFWQGIDVPGAALQNVIITKLPFDVPDDPIIKAKVGFIEQQGGNAFLEYSLPRAIIRLRQAFGRLIRTKEDRGLVAILDSRIFAKSYGRQVLEALPDCPVFLDGEKYGDSSHQLAGTLQDASLQPPNRKYGGRRRGRL
jgi:ATP-dependent DNA helicase DinG